METKMFVEKHNAGEAETLSASRVEKSSQCESSSAGDPGASRQCAGPFSGNIQPIFVFGSNREGRHGKGAALEAKRNHGALNGQASGLQGRSYAIVTKELRRDRLPVTIDEVKKGVVGLIEFANKHPEMRFYVTPIGCGLAGFEPDKIAPMFEGSPANVILPPQFKLVTA